MKSKLHQLDYVLNIEKFQKIQDDIAKATGMAMISIDFTGHAITDHSSCSSFCQTVRKNNELEPYCEKCDSRGGLEAARSGEPYIYLCHLGVVDIAVPIMVEGQYIGAVMAGQVRLENEDNNDELEHIVSKKYQYDYDKDPELKKWYDQLPVMSLEQIKNNAQMMKHIINYIVEEAVLKASLYEAQAEEASESDVQLYYTVEEDRDNQVQQPSQSTKTSLIRPALNYIESHLDEKIYLEKMAYICNISPSYFSKIFKREQGTNFSSYVVAKKLEAAKKVLEETNQPIVNISLDFGFEDAGYFIKVFKKAYGETPASYRKNRR